MFSSFLTSSLVSSAILLALFSGLTWKFVCDCCVDVSAVVALDEVEEGDFVVAVVAVVVESSVVVGLILR